MPRDPQGAETQATQGYGEFAVRAAKAHAEAECARWGEDYATSRLTLRGADVDAVLAEMDALRQQNDEMARALVAWSAEPRPQHLELKMLVSRDLLHFALRPRDAVFHIAHEMAERITRDERFTRHPIPPHAGEETKG